MPRYRYIARDKLGKRVTDFVFAENEDDLEEQLSRLGYILISAQTTEPKLSKKPIKLSQNQILEFTINLASLLEGGLNLMECLNILLLDTKDERSNILITRLRDYIEAGGEFHEALKLFPKSFSRFYISMVAAGEKMGKIGFILKQLADHLEWRMDLRAKVRELTAYPAIIFTLLILVVSLLVRWVLPKFEPIFEDLGVELPLLTSMVLGASRLFKRFWYIGLIVLFFFAIGTKLALKKPNMRFHFDKLKIKLPIIGGLLYKISLSHLCRSIGLGLACGITVIENLDLGQEIIGNAVLSRAISRVKESVVTGGGLATSFELSGVFPPLFIRAVGVGERSGSLVEELERVCKIYDRTVPRTIKKIFTIMEPALIALMGGIVGTIALAVLLPLLKVVSTIGG